MNGYADDLTIFISHRHEDKAIADQFRSAFKDWTNGKIEVFQSSNADNALRIGMGLDSSIKDAISNSNIVLLIYTNPNADWSWCMYECGLAQDPEAMDTKLVVFHCTEEPPSPLSHLVTVPFKEEAIRTLTDDFHKDGDFFPRYSGAFAPGIDVEQIDERSRELYDDLVKTISKTSAMDVQRHDYFVLDMDLIHVDNIRKVDREEGFIAAQNHARQAFEKDVYIRRIFGDPYSSFNYGDAPIDIKFSDLVGRWAKDSEHADFRWEEEVYEEMARVVVNQKERGLSRVFRSVEPDTEVWFLPIVTHFRTLPATGKAEFDLLLCPIQSSVAQKMLNLKD